MTVKYQSDNHNGSSLIAPIAKHESDELSNGSESQLLTCHRPWTAETPISAVAGTGSGLRGSAFLGILRYSSMAVPFTRGRRQFWSSKSYDVGRSSLG